MWLFTLLACQEPLGDPTPLDAAGAACIQTAQEGLAVFVDFDTCLDCATLEATCEVNRQEARIEVTAQGQIVPERCEEAAGTCEPATVGCAAAPAPAGTYTLVYGGEEVPVELPAYNWVCTGPAPAQ